MTETLTSPITESGDALPEDRRVIDGMTIRGRINVNLDTLQAQIRHGLTRQHPQVKRQALQTDRVCLVAGGPSLNDTLPELMELLREGAKLVTMNGSLQWALDHNLTPSAHVLLDAREGNARFVGPPLPRCQYLIASSVHPSVWDALDAGGHRHVWIFHPFERDAPEAQILNDYYGERVWEAIPGGTTVGSCAVLLLRTLGYVSFDLFGVDCCYLHGEHHAFPQPENADDARYVVTAAPQDAPQLAREFTVAAWHLRSLEDWLKMLRLRDDVGHVPFMLRGIHGDGLLAHCLRTKAEVLTTAEELRHGSRVLESQLQDDQETV